MQICSPDIFPTYFKFTLPNGQISNIEMQAILSLSNDVNAFSEKIVELSKRQKTDGSTMASVFLERLQDFTREDIIKADIKKILESFFNIGDKLLLSEDNSDGFFGYDNDTRMGRIFFQLIKRFESHEERFDILEDLFTKGQSISTIVSRTAVLGQQHGKYGGTEKDDENAQIVNAEQLMKLEKIALGRIKIAALNNDLLKLPSLSRILNLWKQLENEDAPRKWIIESNILMQDENIAIILTSFLSKVHSQSIDDVVTKTTWRLAPKTIEPFMNPQNIIDTCRQIINQSPEWLVGERKIAVETFIKEYDNPVLDTFK